MADISIYEESIRTQERGETVRDAVISSLKAIDDNAENTELLEFHPSNYFAKKTDIRPFIYDELPTKDSDYLVESNGLWEVIGNAEIAAEASSGTLAYRIHRLHEVFADICKEITEKEVPWNLGNPIREYGNAIRQIYNYFISETVITKNGSYETDKKSLWNRVVVKVAKTIVVPLTVTKNGKYEAPDGYSYKPVTVDVDDPFKVEYDEVNHILRMSCLITIDDETSRSEAEKSVKDYIDAGYTTAEIYDLLDVKGTSQKDIISTLAGNSTGNQLVTVLMSNGTKIEDTVSFLRDEKYSAPDIFTALTNSADSDGADGVMAMVKNGFNIDSIVTAIKGSSTNQESVIDAIKNSSSEYLGVDKDELLSKLGVKDD